MSKLPDEKNLAPDEEVGQDVEPTDEDIPTPELDDMDAGEVEDFPEEGIEIRDLENFEEEEID